jgi:single-stranded-DNA-specific exonuclease
MDIASDVVEMFLTRDGESARELAQKLHRLNDERRATEAEALRAIEAQIEGMAGEAPACLVMDDAGAAAAWHRGVIGILASRVVDKTGKPALVVTHEEGQAYGSGRSVSGFHLLDALTAVDGEGVERLFTRFGGHAHAVGFSLASEQVGVLRERMVRYAEERKDAGEVAQELACDAEVRLGDLTEEFLAALERMGPFGMGNAEPVLISRGVRLSAALKVIKERHLRVSVEDIADGAKFGGMAWSRRTDWAAMAEMGGWSSGDLMDVAYRLRRNWHPTYGGWELEIVGIRPARDGEA